VILCAGLGVLFSLYFMVLQVALIRAFCIYCLISAVTTLLLAVVAMRTCMRRRLASIPAEAGLHRVGLVPSQDVVIEPGFAPSEVICASRSKEERIRTDSVRRRRASYSAARCSKSSGMIQLSAFQISDHGQN
jgi:hypothetical protein